ncbi:MAG: DNA repair protein [Candidatus Eremiobacter antarcticus]|nr:DUF488 domain-containing protein [Candidatus Eremiobacteraeota bacterium]MBC5809161.1 DUF488 domain-containing protein [Candidatus Eremiobacteraeota bacterium]PZR61586.1 MAG: DNA repair protein [Candidatus Eremiobacter sp. RRmetagenome_bin22]PZR68238.1 MAG: DNA repair protein [Solirubrobacterales bacterium]
MRLLTLGHGTLAIAAFVDLVRAADVASIVDVRTVPKSRHNPQFEREAMEQWTNEAGLTYAWEPRLGGFRRPKPDSPNIGLRHPAFRGYADYMQTAEFWVALDEVLDRASTAPSAIMCSESLWWRCHRRLIADAAVLARGVEVLDLFHSGRRVPHPITPCARLLGDMVVYDVLDQPPLPSL